MTHDEAYDWVYQQEERDPHWAHSEFDARRGALEAQHKLRSPGWKGEVSISIVRPDRTHPLGSSIKIVTFSPTRLGGVEELLLFEEQIRRAMRGE